jgi:hypothetical protein
MALPILVGVGAFVILAIMLALLWTSARSDEKTDAVTQEIIIKANTGPVIVHAPVDTTQEEEH